MQDLKRGAAPSFSYEGGETVYQVGSPCCAVSDSNLAD